MTLTQFFVLLGIIIIIVCIPIQRRALNKIAFGRSMFISFSALVMGVLVAVLRTTNTNIAYAIVSFALFIIGFGMLILMAIKSYQHMKTNKR